VFFVGASRQRTFGAVPKNFILLLTAAKFFLYLPIFV
jgi:hypothetical protein